MQTYPKTYEDVYSTDKKGSTTKFYIEGSSAGEMELDTYVLLFRSFLKDFYSSLFDNCVRLAWLRRKFAYNGRRLKLPMNENAMLDLLAFSKLLRRDVGIDIQIITKGKFFSKIEIYFDELFPGFDDGNPFENPDYYKLPFEHVTMDFLMVVHQLDDRIKLLKYADEKKMNYAEFVDYSINHVLCINEGLDKPRYEMRQKKDRNFPFYIKDKTKEIKKYIPKNK